MDDPFYKDRYGAKVWAVKGQRYTAGFDTNSRGPTSPADAEIDATSELPLPDARLYVIASNPPEGLLLLERHGRVAIAGDCLQHWEKADPYFSFLGRHVMRAMGFLVPHNVGPGWLKQGKPPKPDLRGILESASRT